EDEQFIEALWLHVVGADFGGGGLQRRVGSLVQRRGRGTAEQIGPGGNDHRPGDGHHQHGQQRDVDQLVGAGRFGGRIGGGRRCGQAASSFSLTAPAHERPPQKESGTASL